MFVQTPSESQFRILALRFEQLHDIPYIIYAIDGSHIHILVMVVGGEDYYCKIFFYLVIILEIVNLFYKF